MKIIWSPRALREFEAEVNWIAEHRPMAARKWAERTNGSVQRLSIFPMSGRRVPEFPRVGAREVVSGRYRVFYRVQRGQVVVLTLKHSREEVSLRDVLPEEDETP